MFVVSSAYYHSVVSYSYNHPLSLCEGLSPRDLSLRIVGARHCYDSDSSPKGKCSRGVPGFPHIGASFNPCIARIIMRNCPIGQNNMIVGIFRGRRFVLPTFLVADNAPVATPITAGNDPKV